jgi:prepilin-type N-terminal cleavage/methylation domain-containing protein
MQFDLISCTDTVALRRRQRGAADRQREAGYTLLELLVVLAIMAVMALITPVAMQTEMARLHKQSALFEATASLEALHEQAIDTQTVMEGQDHDGHPIIFYPDGSAAALEFRQGRKQISILPLTGRVIVQ